MDFECLRFPDTLRSNRRVPAHYVQKVSDIQARATMKDPAVLAKYSHAAKKLTMVQDDTPVNAKTFPVMPNIFFLGYRHGHDASYTYLSHTIMLTLKLETA